MGAIGRDLIGVGIGGRFARGHAERRAYSRPWANRLERPKTRSLRQVHGVRGAQEIDQALASRRMHAFQIAKICNGRRLVEQYPIRNAIAQHSDNLFDVVGKTRCRIAIRPSAGIFQGLRQVPVIERDQRTDFRFQKCIDDAAVIIGALGIYRSRSRRLNARPGNREAITVQIHGLHQCDVFGPAVVGIASYVSRIAILDFARRVRKAIPDRFALAVFLPRALNLISGSCGAPEKILRKRGRIKGFKI